METAEIFDLPRPSELQRDCLVELNLSQVSRAGESLARSGCQIIGVQMKSRKGHPLLEGKARILYRLPENWNAGIISTPSS